jgi:hypothetical protein
MQAILVDAGHTLLSEFLACGSKMPFRPRNGGFRHAAASKPFLLFALAPTGRK